MKIVIPNVIGFIGIYTYGGVPRMRTIKNLNEFCILHAKMIKIKHCRSPNIPRGHLFEILPSDMGVRRW